MVLRRFIGLAVLATWLSGSGAPQSSGASWNAGAPRLADNSCTASCRAQHNQCRIATKGSPSCDAQLQACMQRCISSSRGR